MQKKFFKILTNSSKSFLKKFVMKFFVKKGSSFKVLFSGSFGLF